MERSRFSLGCESIAHSALGSSEIARQLSRSRREFLRDAAGVALGTALMSASPFVRAESARTVPGTSSPGRVRRVPCFHM